MGSPFGRVDGAICRFANLDYNPLMFSPLVIRTPPQKVIAQALANLGDVAPPGLLLRLAQVVNDNVPRNMSDTLITRSVCQLRQLQAAAPQLHLSPGKLLEAINAPRQQRSREERAFTQALLEFFIGLIL